MVRARWILALIAGAAMVGSHWVAYLLAAPDAHDRAVLLDATGHGYWPLAATLAVAAIFIGLAAFAAERLHPGATATRGDVFRSAAPKLLGLQVVGFVLLEVTERLAAGHAIEAATFVGPTMLIGLLVQLVAAVVAAAVLGLVAYAIERFVARPPRVRRPTFVPRFTSLVSAPRPLLATGAHTLRGPPNLS
ncbi:MAG TPA: hypothetical protein VG929_10705 [Actinomycetota bacterium]|nr:hypothetical protein [Actinomycetota bacterium]